MSQETLSRRGFLAGSAAVGAGLAMGMASREAAAAEKYPPLKLAVQFGMLPKELSLEDKFALVKRCGFDGVEAYPMDDLDEAKHMAEVARAQGAPIHSLVYGGWKNPLTSPDPAVVDRGKAGVENALRTAKAYGCPNILLVPGIVTEEVRYVDAYARSQKHIRELLPLAEELQIVIAVEEVWNKFLLSPIEFARYVDEFESPWLKAYFDVGNVVIHGYPQDWIRTLGKRIEKVHFKDFTRKTYKWENLYNGDVNWPEVRKAFAEVGYHSFCTAEMHPGNEAYLRDLSNRMHHINNGDASPS